MTRHHLLTATITALALVAAPGCEKKDDATAKTPEAAAAAPAGDKAAAAPAGGAEAEAKKVADAAAKAKADADAAKEKANAEAKKIADAAKAQAAAGAMAAKTAAVQGPIPAPSDVAAPPADAKTTEAGVSYKVLNASGSTEAPKAENAVTVHYTGWTTDGKMFDSSRTRGAPATFPLGGVIAGWTDGLQHMNKGDEVRFWIPEAMAYGGKPGRPAGMLVFDVELLEIK